MVASQSTGTALEGQALVVADRHQRGAGVQRERLRTSGMSRRPCMVITVGVADSSANGSVHTSVWAWMMSNSSLRL